MSTPVVLITGCSSGIGLALARAFADAGYKVWATARRPEDLERLSAEGFEARPLDVNDVAAANELIASLTAKAGRLDVLVNNAGYGAMGPLLDGGARVLFQQFSTNAFAPIELVRSAFDLLRDSRGLVINIGSVSGVLTTPFAGAYCASKAALHALTNALRLELLPFGIRVMEVQPGAIESSFGASAEREAWRTFDTQSPWWPLRHAVQARAKASQVHPTPARTVATEVLRAAQRQRPPRILRVGHGSFALPLLSRWLPGRWLDRLLARRFALDQPLPPHDSMLGNKRPSP